MASPLLNFALIGRKSSGKTCLLTALALPKELNEYGLNCNLSRSKKRYEEYLNQNSVKEFFGDESVAKYDEMLDHIDVLINKIKEGKLPDATPLTGKTAHIYNVDTTKQVNFDMALFDYAGELVEAESRVSDSLLKFLGNMSGLMVIVELGPNTSEGRKQASLDISNLQQFFKAIETNTEGKTRFNIPIALLITKFDQHPDFNKAEFDKDGQKYVDRLFKEFIESPSGKNIKALSNSIQSSTSEGFFKIYPVCAFGYVETKTSKTSSVNDKPKEIVGKKSMLDMFNDLTKEVNDKESKLQAKTGNVSKESFEIEFPLKSINVIEPFVWAAETYGYKLLKEVDEAVNKSGIVNGLFNTFLKDYSSVVKTAENLIPNDSEQKNQLEVLEKKSSGLSKKLYVSLVVSFILIFLVAEFWLDRSTIVNFQKEEINIENALKHQEWLKNYSLSPFYRHSLAKLFIMPSQEATKTIDSIFGKIDEQLWNTASSENDTKLLLMKLNDYIENPYAKRKEEAKNKIDEILWNDISNANSPDLIVIKLNEYIANPYAKRIEEAKNKIDETLWKDILNTTEPKVLIDKLKQYLNNTYAKKTDEALDKLEATLWKDVLQTSETSLQLEKLNNYLELANAKHIDEAKTKVKEISFDLRKNTWIDKIVKLEKKINSNVEINQSFIDTIKEEFSIVKSEYDELFNQKQRLKDLETSYNKLITSYNLKIFEEAKAEIVNNINLSEYDNWLAALDQTIDLHNKELVSLEKWTKFANDTVVQQLYNNCETLVSDAKKDAFTKVEILTKINNSSSLQQIKSFTGYVKGEKEYFSKKIYKVKRTKLVKDYNEIADFAIKNNNSLSVLIKQNDRVNEQINSFLSYFDNNPDMKKEFNNNIKQLTIYQQALLNAKKEQILQVSLVKTVWPREQFIEAIKSVKVFIAGKTIEAKTKTNSKTTSWKEGVFEAIKITPNEETITIQAQVIDKSAANYDIVCNGLDANYDNLSILNNNSLITIGVKGVLEGLTSLTDTEYNGSVTIKTKWVSNMPKLERIK